MLCINAQSLCASSGILRPLRRDICDPAEKMRSRLEPSRELQSLRVFLRPSTSNPRDAMMNGQYDPRLVALSILVATIASYTAGRPRLTIRVEDDGEGIAPENLPRLFTHGFTTRKNGHGFGLHSCAPAAKEMYGTMTAHSDGPGKGAAFTLELPAIPA
jgi:signal transduction histidine kinase